MNGSDQQANPPPAPPPGTWITVAEAAGILQCSEKTVRRLIERGEIAGVQRGKYRNDPILLLRGEVERLAAAPAGGAGDPGSALLRIGDLSGRIGEVRGDLSKLVQALPAWTRLDKTVQSETRRIRYLIGGVAVLVLILAGFSAWTVYTNRVQADRTVQAVSKQGEEVKTTLSDTRKEAAEAGEKARTAAGEVGRLTGRIGDLEAQIRTLSGQIRELAARTPPPAPSPAITPAAVEVETPAIPAAPSPGPARTPEESGGFLGIF